MTLGDDKRAYNRLCVQKVDCPVCGQQAGHGCITVTNVALMTPHDARRGAAWRADRARIEG